MKISGIKAISSKEMTVIQGGARPPAGNRFTRPGNDNAIVSVTHIEMIRPGCC